MYCLLGLQSHIKGGDRGKALVLWTQVSALPNILIIIVGKIYSFPPPSLWTDPPESPLLFSSPLSELIQKVKAELS